MIQTVYRYRFAADVPLEEVEITLLLAVWATESLHGEAQVRLDARLATDRASRSCLIDAGSPVGADLNRLFVGFLRREIGNDFQVERLAISSSVRSESRVAA
jgi:hypothetical protein